MRLGWVLFGVSRFGVSDLGRVFEICGGFWWELVLSGFVFAWRFPVVLLILGFCFGFLIGCVVVFLMLLELVFCERWGFLVVCGFGVSVLVIWVGLLLEFVG